MINQESRVTLKRKRGEPSGGGNSSHVGTNAQLYHTIRAQSSGGLSVIRLKQGSRSVINIK